MHISDGLRAYGIKRKAVIILVILPFLLISLNCLEASSQTTLTSPSHVSLGDSILLAGVFCYFDVTVPEDHTKLCIIAYNGEVEPSIQERSEKNYYQWERGATTFWEQWDGRDSHNHPMFGACCVELFYGILGMRQHQGTHSFSEPTFEPKLPRELNRVSGSIMTPSGELRVTVYRDENGDIIIDKIKE